MTPIDIAAGLVSAALALMAWSLLYKENGFYRLGENLLVGGTIGYGVVLGLKAVWSHGVVPAMQGDLWLGLAVVVGLLFFVRFFGRKYVWYSRIPLAVLLGVGFGVSLNAMIQAQITVQLIATMKSLFVGGNILETINNIVIFVGVVTTMFYFVYSIEHKGPLNTVSKIGRYVMMVAFGGSFGFNLLGRIAMLVSPMQAVVVPPGAYLIPVALAIMGYVLWRDLQKRRAAETKAAT